MPVLTLEAQEGRLFRPLAYTKNFSMIIAAILAITLDPALRLMFTHVQTFSFRPRWMARVANAVLVGRIHSEESHPISRTLIRVYEPVCSWALRWKWLVLGGAVAAVVATVPVYQRLGSEFMPPLDEGSLLYMPSTLPGISVTEAQRLLQTQDCIIKQFPEVERVLGKAGRADTSTDPGSVLDDGNGHHAEAARPVAPRRRGTPRGHRHGSRPRFDASRPIVSPLTRSFSR
ncbi:MAG: efflux RND transporter permease subunit [Vicinamibacterales bacterium]